MVHQPLVAHRPAMVHPLPAVLEVETLEVVRLRPVMVRQALAEGKHFTSQFFLIPSHCKVSIKNSFLYKRVSCIFSTEDTENIRTYFNQTHFCRFALLEIRFSS